MSRSQQVARPLVWSARPAPLSAPATAKMAASRASTRRNLATTTDGEPLPPGTDATEKAVLLGRRLSSSDIPAGGTLSAEDAVKKRRHDAWFRRMMNPNTTTIAWAERKLMKLGTPPVGSRRKRAAIRTSGNLPFAQLPYQCFQEARKILNDDRQQKIAEMVRETEKIRRLEAADPSTFRAGEYYKQKRLRSLRQHVEHLKILADINDAQVRRRFEDGFGDMRKPIYRYYAKRKWRSMDYKIVKQRIEQFDIVPDLLPKFQPCMDVKLHFRGYRVRPGEILLTRMTELPPSLHIQVFDRGERLISVAILDSDVPDAEHDSYGRRLHYLGTNIPWDPTRKTLSLAQIGRRDQKGTTAVPWLPPFAQKGSSKHRLSVFVLEQEAPVSVEALQKYYSSDAGRKAFSMRSLADRFPSLKAKGFSMFRTQWDETTLGVMERNNIPGADVEFRPVRIKSMKPPKKARGWEAKRQGPKYRHLWKYTKRIA